MLGGAVNSDDVLFKGYSASALDALVAQHETSRRAEPAKYIKVWQ